LVREHDHSCGIPFDEITRITEPFYVVDKSQSKKYGGSGLGLALAKAIATAHSESIGIDRTEGEGTSIIIGFER